MIAGLLLPALLGPLQDASPSIPPWKFRARSADYRYDGDTVLQLFEAPVFTSGNRELRASWLVLWLDRAQLGSDPDQATDELEALRRELEQVGSVDAPHQAPSLFGRFGEIEVTKLAQELYLEGPIVYLEDGKIVGQAGALYLDMVDGHGWIAEAEISAERSIRGEMTRLRLITDWLRHSADGSLRASDAVVTSCGFDDPHFHLRSGDLRIEPRDEAGEVQFDVELRDNFLQLTDSIGIPLPKLSYPAGSDYTPRYEGFRLGNSARFGTFAEAQVNGDAGRIGQRISEFLGDNPLFPRGDASLRFRWLGSRGILLDGSVEFEEPGSYDLEIAVGGLPDRGEDRGIVRVDESERRTARVWARVDGRFIRDDQQWVDVRGTAQTDPGVQAEFWERDYVRYEARDNYVNWRRAHDEYYLYGTVLARTESFRREVQELPRVGATRFASELFRLGSQPILYSTDNEAAYLERVEGDSFPLPPPTPRTGFEPPFPDGLGERRVVRVDSLHRLEAPFSLGLAGIRVVPFLEGRATTWDRGVSVDDSPTRFAAFGGVRAQTSIWKRRGNGGLHEISPFASFYGDFDVKDRDGVPVRFDTTEDEIEGHFVELGLRSRWLKASGFDEIDVELRATHASSVPGTGDRWRPLSVFASAYRTIFGLPFSFWHDARYDFDLDRTNYSLTSVGFEPSDKWGIQFSHQRGKDLAGQTLFEAATIATRYRWTPKWEFEGELQIPILDGGEDVFRYTLRRFGHDFLFELEFQERTGEGGSTIGISFRPLLGFRRNRIGVAPR